MKLGIMMISTELALLVLIVSLPYLASCCPLGNMSYTPGLHILITCPQKASFPVCWMVKAPTPLL